MPQCCAHRAKPPTAEVFAIGGQLSLRAFDTAHYHPVSAAQAPETRPAKSVGFLNQLSAAHNTAPVKKTLADPLVEGFVVGPIAGYCQLVLRRRLFLQPEDRLSHTRPLNHSWMLHLVSRCCIQGQVLLSRFHAKPLFVGALRVLSWRASGPRPGLRPRRDSRNRVCTPFRESSEAHSPRRALPAFRAIVYAVSALWPAPEYRLATALAVRSSPRR